jgi:hypothetical protein
LLLLLQRIGRGLCASTAFAPEALQRKACGPGVGPGQVVWAVAVDNLATHASIVACCRMRLSANVQQASQPHALQLR